MYRLLKCNLPCQYSYSASDWIFLFGQTGNSLNSYPSLVTQELTPLQPVINDRRKLNYACVDK